MAAEGQQELRSHRTEVALFSVKEGKLRKTGDTLPISYSGAETAVAGAVGKPCPELVFPNYNDQDYVRVELDPVSLETAKKRLSQLEGPFVRQMVWLALDEMLFDAKLPAGDYIEIALKQAGSETDTQVLERIVGNLVSPSASRNTALRFLTGGARDEAQLRMERFFREKLQAAPASSDLQLTWLGAYLSAAKSEKAVEFLSGLLKGTQKLPGLRIDQERRWEIIGTLARLGAPYSQDLIAEEKKKDATEMGMREAISAEVSLPSADIKRRWLAKILRTDVSDNLTTAKLRDAMRSFWLFGQENLLPEAADAFFRELPRIAAGDDEEHFKSFARRMLPATCDSVVVQRITQLLDGSKLPAQVVRSLRIARQEEERCLKARALAAPVSPAR
jgi:aminopeptidase N